MSEFAEITVTADDLAAAYKSYNASGSITQSCVVAQAVRRVIPDAIVVTYRYSALQGMQYAVTANGNQTTLPESLNEVARAFDRSLNMGVPFDHSLLPVTETLRVPR